jgi:hypothetical protein
VTAVTLRAQPSGLAGLGRCGGDAQERAATNPVAALPCAPTPLLIPLSTPLLSTPAALVFLGGGSVRAWRGPDGVDATWTRPARSSA